MSYPPPPPPEQPVPYDPTRRMDPTAPPPPPPPPFSGAPGSPAAPPPGSPAAPGSPPVFQPGVASPSYSPPPGFDTGTFQPTGTYQPTSVYQQGSGYAGYPPAPGKSPGGPGGARSGGAVLWVLIAVFAVLLCGGASVAGFLAFRNTGNSASPPPAPAPVPQTDPTSEPSSEPTASTPAGAGTITFEVTGDGPASISYTRGSGQGSERVQNADLPWRMEVPMERKSFLASLIATRSGTKKGSLTCRMLLDGKQVATRTAKGTFATVSCFHFVTN